MRWLLVICAACSSVHSGGSSPQLERARAAQQLRERCSILTGIRQQTCLQHGTPRAPERELWANATWWLYETRSWDMVAGCVECVGPQVVCASYVAFDGDRVIESDEQCHQVKHYVP